MSRFRWTSSPATWAAGPAPDRGSAERGRRRTEHRGHRALRRARGCGSAGEHAELVGALRSAAGSAGVHVVINARTDLFLRKDGDDSDRIERAVATDWDEPPPPVPMSSIRRAVTTWTHCGAWPPSCRCRSTRSPCPIRMTRRHSGRWVWAGSALARSCRPHWPAGRGSCWPAGADPNPDRRRDPGGRTAAKPLSTTVIGAEQAFRSDF